MPTYKLTYFNWRGITELTRYILALAGQEYEDIRIEEAEWPQIKEGTPLGQLPFLEVDGEKIPQSMAINRYLARKFGFYGESEMEKVRIDVVLEVLTEFNQQATTQFIEKDEARKEALLKELTDVHAPKYLGMLEKLLTANQGGDGFFVGSKISIADVAAFNCIYDKLPVLKITNKEPKLQALQDRVESLPQIDTWLKKRPKTGF